MKLLKKIKAKKKVVYAQVLYGTHAISASHNVSYLGKKEKFLLSVAEFVPFKFFREKYKRLLNDVNAVIPNSEITATFLQTLYGVATQGVIYPPVDTTVFKRRDVKKRNQVIFYLGSNAGDTNFNFLKTACHILNRKNIDVFMLGNPTFKNLFMKKFKGVKNISGISDRALAKTYSESKLTICPQKWEQFGYVVAESIASGTPVLAFNLMGPKEIIESTNFGLLVNSDQEFISELKMMNLNRIEEAQRIHKILPFSVGESSSKLYEMIKRV